MNESKIEKIVITLDGVLMENGVTVDSVNSWFSFSNRGGFF